MPTFLQLQYFRGILVVNDLVALIICFVCAERGWYRASVFDVLGSFLAISWIQSVAVLAEITRIKFAAPKAGYFRVPTVTDDFQIQPDGGSDQQKMGSTMTTVTIAFDVVCAVAILTATVFSFILGYDQAQTIASVGGVVAAAIHIFMLCSVFYYCCLGKYRIKLTLVRKDHDGRSVAIDRSKEHFRKESSLPDSEPEQLSPRPYRGSPSVKPAPTSGFSTTGPIKLVEPTEGDALIADHD